MTPPGMASVPADDVSISFAKGCWSPEDWRFVRSPRWEEQSHWVQQEDCIANFVPEDWTGWDRPGEAYVSMLYRKPFHGNTAFHTRCAFDDRMAPVIVFTGEESDIYHDYLEVALYDCGINLWHHYFIDGKPSWQLLGFHHLDLEKGAAHDFSAQFVFQESGCLLIMGCDGTFFGSRIDGAFPPAYYAGITGSEGRNRFYDFTARRDAILPYPIDERLH